MAYSRKPTRGSQRYIQIVTHRKNEAGILVPLVKTQTVPAAYNKAGELIRQAFTFDKPVTKQITHYRTPSGGEVFPDTKEKDKEGQIY